MPAAVPLIGLGLAAVGAGAAVVGTINTAKAQNRALDAQKQQYAYEQQLNQNKYVQSRRDAIRTARITAGAVQQAGETQGVSSSSAALGGLGSIQSQLSTNLSFLDTQKSLSDSAGAASMVAETAKVNAQKWQGVTSLGIQLFNSADSIAGKFKHA